MVSGLCWPHKRSCEVFLFPLFYKEFCIKLVLISRKYIYITLFGQRDVADELSILTKENILDYSSRISAAPKLHIDWDVISSKKLLKIVNLTRVDFCLSVSINFWLFFWCFLMAIFIKNFSPDIIIIIWEGLSNQSALSLLAIILKYIQNIENYLLRSSTLPRCSYLEPSCT